MLNESDSLGAAAAAANAIYRHLPAQRKRFSATLANAFKFRIKLNRFSRSVIYKHTKIAFKRKIDFLFFVK